MLFSKIKFVNDKKEFLNLIETEEKSIIFCFHNWSGYSIIAKNIVEEWESNFKREVRIVDASKMNEDSYFIKWLIQKEKGDWAKEGIMTIGK
ncbi:MAG: hypothetical protein AB8G86_23425 [Saprospiraceae bacterium]